MADLEILNFLSNLLINTFMRPRGAFAPKDEEHFNTENDPRNEYDLKIEAT